MRAAAQLSLEQWALERAGLLEEEPYRRGHRDRASSSTRSRRWRRSMPAAVRIRLHRALSVVYGIEPYMILKDIWGLPDREVERIALWMADALIDAAQRDAAAAAAAVPRVRAVRTRNAGGGQRRVPRMSERSPAGRRDGAAAALARMVRRAVQQPRPHSRASADPRRSGPTDRRRPAPRCRRRSTSPTAATPASGSTCSRPPRRGRRCWSTSTAATGARSTSATPRSSPRRSSPPARWWCVPNYALCPAASIDEIVRQQRAALAWVWRHAARARRRPGTDRRRRAFGRRPSRGDDACHRLARHRSRPAGRPGEGRALALRRVRARAAAPRALPRARPASRRRRGARASARSACRRRSGRSSRSSAATRARSSCARTSASRRRGDRPRCRSARRCPGAIT